MSTLRELERASTPGPWTVYDAPRPGVDAGDATVLVFGTAEEEAGFERAADAALIVALRNAAPMLLDMLDAIGEVAVSPSALGSALAATNVSAGRSIEEATVHAAASHMLKALAAKAALESILTFRQTPAAAAADEQQTGETDDRAEAVYR